jgi:putative transposase
MGENRDRRTLFGEGTNRTFYLPRLPREYYQGDAAVHWTMPIAFRAKGWLNETFHGGFRQLMLHAAAREAVFCPTYCLMPDHIHLVWVGLRRNSDQRDGMKFLREHLGRLLRPYRFQHQAHDHVLRAEERQRRAFAAACFYIIDNARAAAWWSTRKLGLMQERLCRAIPICIHWRQNSGPCSGKRTS